MGVEQDVVAKQLVHVVGRFHLDKEIHLVPDDSHLFLLSRVHLFLQGGKPTEDALHDQVSYLESESLLSVRANESESERDLTSSHI